MPQSEAQRVANKRYYAKHREKLLAQHKQWRAANPGRMKELNAEWFRRNHESATAARKAWTKAHPDYNKTWRLLKMGCPPEQYQKFYEEQKGVCAICGKKPKVLHVDHDHESGKIRGLLCFRCNSALGLADDNISTLEAAIAYLKK